MQIFLIFAIVQVRMHQEKRVNRFRLNVDQLKGIMEILVIVANFDKYGHYEELFCTMR